MPHVFSGPAVETNSGGGSGENHPELGTLDGPGSSSSRSGSRSPGPRAALRLHPGSIPDLDSFGSRPSSPACAVASSHRVDLCLEASDAEPTTPSGSASGGSSGRSRDSAPPSPRAGGATRGAARTEPAGPGVAAAAGIASGARRMVGRLSLQPVAGERFEAATRRSHESLLLLDSPDSGLPPSPSHPLEPAAQLQQQHRLLELSEFQQQQQLQDVHGHQQRLQDQPHQHVDEEQHQQQQRHQQRQHHRRADSASPPLLCCSSSVDGFGDLATATARRPDSGFMGGAPSPPLRGPPRPGVLGVAEEPRIGGGGGAPVRDPQLGRLLPYVTLCGGFGGPGGTGAPRLVPSDYSEGVCVQAGPRATSTRCCSEVRFACGRRYRDGVECEPALAVASCRQTVVARPSTTRRSFTSELRLEPRQRERRHTATAFAFPRHARHLFRTTVTSGGDAAAVASGASSAAPAARGAGTRYTSCVRLQSLAPPSVGIVYREDGRAGT
ncbi:uncharacterized protein LOC144719641 [Lampetra planeri]